MRTRGALLLAPAFALALLVNALLFGAAALLTGERGLPQDISEPMPVSLVQIPRPALPERAAPPPPREKPEPRPRLDFQPELAPLSLADPNPPRIVVDVRPQPLGDVGVPGGLVFSESELDSRPHWVVRTVEYPYRARQRGLEGEVDVKLLVRRDGTVGEVQILAARPEGVFEEAVRRAAAAWRFEPGRIAGEAVDAWVVTTVSFRMNER